MKSIYSKEQEKAIFDAVWQWVLDHSDLTHEGVLFLKAHIKDKNSFAKSVAFRARGSYRSWISDELIYSRQRDSILSQTEMRQKIKEVEAKNKEILEKKFSFQKFLQRLLYKLLSSRIRI